MGSLGNLDQIGWHPSKGGVVIAIKQGLDIPIKMLGAGKGIDALRSFNAR
ncbi:hypothetical protein [Desulfoscipio gibsoniae]